MKCVGELFILSRPCVAPLPNGQAELGDLHPNVTVGLIALNMAPFQYWRRAVNQELKLPRRSLRIS
jgi:hypothetical protein